MALETRTTAEAEELAKVESKIEKADKKLVDKIRASREAGLPEEPKQADPHFNPREYEQNVGTAVENEDPDAPREGLHPAEAQLHSDNREQLLDYYIGGKPSSIRMLKMLPASIQTLTTRHQKALPVR